MFYVAPCPAAPVLDSGLCVILVPPPTSKTPTLDTTRATFFRCSAYTHARLGGSVRVCGTRAAASFCSARFMDVLGWFGSVNRLLALPILASTNALRILREHTQQHHRE